MLGDVNMQVTGYAQASVQVGVISQRGEARRPAWPFGRFTFGAIGCSVRPLGAHREALTTFAWSDVAVVEPTARGVRFEFRDQRPPVAMRTLRASARTMLMDISRAYCPAGTVSSPDHADQAAPASTAA